MSLGEIKTAIEQLSFEHRAELAAWFHGWEDDHWDEQMKRDIAEGKLDLLLREVEDDIRAGRLREMPWSPERIGDSGVSSISCRPTFNALLETIFTFGNATPFHPSLQFKPLVGEVWSVRIGDHYRALARRHDDLVVWFWIGTHEAYNKLINQLR